jgi:predicted short-subunit dehydrogenase-like oxidoreductase (DUF2520 family)
MATRIARMEPPPHLGIVHLSGALGLGALGALQDNPRGSFHPLQSFPMPRDPSAFVGVTVAVDATTPALLRRLASLARQLGARPKHVEDSRRVLYHAAAVYASNFVDVVVAEAVRILGRAGWTERDATAALLPLAEGAVDNIRKRGAVQALTGPIRRGDADTVSLHLAALGGLDPSGAARQRPMRNGEGKTTRLYRMLALVALDIARQAGLEPAAAERTRRALTRNVAATRRRGRR